MMKLLLDRGANIESKNQSGNTPLIEGIFINLLVYSILIIYLFLASSFRGTLEMVKLLLERGASVKPVNYRHSESALHKGIFNKINSHLI